MRANDEPAITRGLAHVLRWLGVVAFTLIGWVVAPEDTLILPAEVMFPIGAATISLLVVWALWTYSLYRKTKTDPHSIRQRYTSSEQGWVERDGLRYCAYCISRDPPRQSQLIGSTNDNWKCPDKECKTRYKGEGYTPPPKGSHRRTSNRSIGRDGW